MTLLHLLLLGFALTTTIAAGTPALPSFDQFRVDETFSGNVARPVLKTLGHRAFRTKIREAAAKGPNFGGHYTIGQWGCGSACTSMVTIDATNGSVHNGPFGILGWGESMKYEGKYSSYQNKFVPLSFRLDSRLLIVRGCPEDKDCGSYFYEWTGSRFKLIRKIPAVRLSE